MIAVVLIAMFISVVALIIAYVDNKYGNNRVTIISKIKVRHKGTDTVYSLVVTDGKVKINGEWKPAIVYMGKDEYTKKPCCFIREREDFINNFEYV